MNRRNFLKATALSSVGACLSQYRCSADEPANPSAKPNIVLIMTDDQGWGQTGYYNHPVLKTPNLDAMAANGLRFDRFYAGAPVCSPTRASVLTGRANDRAGVSGPGMPLRIQEKTLPQALLAAGYTTGHFGKWHLNGVHGPGVPISADDARHPGIFGFEEWVSVSNYFDMNPRLSRKGTPEDFKGDSSAVIVGEAMKFISKAKDRQKPFLAVIWDGSPHRPFIASAADRKAFASLPNGSRHHYGELAAFDRSVGVLRKGLRDLNIADNTLVWYCSDNGGLHKIKPDTVGNLRGYKGEIWEGGLRVPGIIEWPAVIKQRVTEYPASTMDIFPTIADILDLPKTAMLKPIDGISIRPLFKRETGKRKEPIPFRYHGQGALVDNDYKLVATSLKDKQFELYNLKKDHREARNIADAEPTAFNKMKANYLKWNEGVVASMAGKDYPAGTFKEKKRKKKK